MNKYLFLSIGILMCVLAGCNRASTTLEPIITCPPHPKEIMRENRRFIALPSNFSTCPFSKLTEEELNQDWGKELKIAYAFAYDFDLFRAITSFKRALFLLPNCETPRRLEIQYNIVLAYYLGRKYTEAIYDVDSSLLKYATKDFPAYSDLLLIIYDCYRNLGECEKADYILKFIREDNPEAAEKFELLSAVECVDLESIESYSFRYPYLEDLFSNYCRETKSIRKAEGLNAFFPGAGYWYVGQKQTAVTAFIVNAAFIAATYHFFSHGNIGAGIFTLSLESGWYFGGIYGAGCAAKLYNERVYETYASKLTCQEKLFPLFQLHYSF